VDVSHKRVLTIANHLGSVGGSEAAQLSIFRGLSERGWAVHVLYVSPGDFFAEWSAFATTTQIRASIPSRSSPIASSVDVVLGAIAGMRSAPSIVYVHNAGDVPIGLAIGAASRTRVAAHLHLPPPFRQPSWLNALMRRTAAVIVPSFDTGQRWTAVAGLDQSLISVIPTGIDMGRFVPLGVEERRIVQAGVGIGEDELMILYVGRLARNKGAHFLIDSVRRLSVPIHLVLCGTPEDTAYLAELEALADGCRVTFLGHRTDIPALMAAADLLVVPSVVFETQGLVIGEAMACGIPVLASDIGGLAESMRGFPEHLVAPAAPADLGRAIASCVNWRQDDPELGPLARAWATEHMPMSRTICTVDETLTAALRNY
jgi:glycosyltransferase involved in cell wall biosynthesis